MQNGGDEQKASETNGKPMRITSGETEICMRMMCGEEWPWASEGGSEGDHPQDFESFSKKRLFS